jgi:hypothetical protein
MTIDQILGIQASPIFGDFNNIIGISHYSLERIAVREEPSTQSVG